MPIIVKNSITQFASTGCMKQLRLSMHPDSAAYQPERSLMNLPHQQVRPALDQIRRAGDEWGYAKVRDLADAFGDAALLGGDRTSTGGDIGGGLRFQESALIDHLTAQVAPHQFLIETQFPVDTDTFRTTHNLHGVATDGMAAPLNIADARPDILEVLPAGSAATVAPNGAIIPANGDDPRLMLRVIDVKLTCEPGAQYFAELAYYCLALAAWLQDVGLSDRFAVSAEPGIWPGSEAVSPLQQAVLSNADLGGRITAFHDALEIAPTRMFISEVLRVLRTVIPEVLRTPFEDLPWAVTPGCQGCEHLGQRFSKSPGTRPSDWDPRHCLPTAETTQHLSRLPFLSRGATQVLRNHGVTNVAEVADLDEADPTFDDHHRLRGQRTIVGSRARALTGTSTASIPHSAPTTVAIPGFANLRLYVTADFDPGSAMTLVFGLHWGWGHQDHTTLTARGPRIHVADNKSLDAEWAALQLLLDDIDGLLSDALALDRTATMQLFVWDTVTFDHLTRVIGRHLGRILASDRLARLAWLFPPEQVMESNVLASAPAVSVVRDAVTTLLSLELAHTYTLVETARVFHGAWLKNATFFIPPFWSDPFSDQIPPERAHQVWRRDTSRNAPTPESLRADLHTTVRTKLLALGTVTREISDQLHGRLPRRPPKITQLGGPDDEGATSHLGVLLLAHARLDQALQELDTSRVRALPITEREAKFESARLTRQLHGNERDHVLNDAGIDVTDTAVAVFELAAGSVQVNAKEGEYSWAVMPEQFAHQIRATYRSFLWSLHDETLIAQWGDNWSASRRTMDRVFGVTILHLDRMNRRLVVQFETWDDTAQQRRALIDSGHVSLEQDLVLDPRSIDAFTGRLRNVVRAIGFPPAAEHDTRVQEALGITRRPRRTAPIAAQDFVWDAAATAGTEFTVPIPQLLQSLQRVGTTLNPSQEAAWRHALERRLTLIWGPPGTGKTATLHAILLSLAELSSSSPLRIAVAANNYTAVDNVLRGLRAGLAETAPGTLLRRVRSSGRAPAPWLAAQENIDTTVGADLARAASELAGDRTVIVGGTPAQLHKLVEESTGGAAGSLFDVIIIDEGGQIDVAHAVVVVAGAAPGARLIIAGDPKQLPPIHAAEPPRGLEPLVGSVYDFFRNWHQLRDQPLLTNYRSNADIVDLARLAGYPSELSAADPNRRLRADGTVTDAGRAVSYSPVIGTIIDPSRPVVCITYDDGVSGQWNHFESHIVQDAVRALWDLLATDPETFWTQRVGIVTPHRAQRALIIDALAAQFAVGEQAAEISEWINSAVDTVERFQGQERDAIIASFAVGDPDTVTEEAEFLHSLNRFNVLATRAKTKLIVIASRQVFDHLDSDLEVLRSSQLIKDFVDVFCNASAAVQLADAAGTPIDVELRWHA